LGVFLLAACMAAQAQTTATQATKKTKPAKSSTVQERMLLEQLDQRFEKMDELNRNYKELQQRVETLERLLETRSTELDEARRDAAAAKADAAAKQQLEATEKVVGPNGAAVGDLQHAVADLKNTSTSLATGLQENQKKLDNPEAINFRGISLKPGGFLAGETVDRTRATSSDVGTPFASIPFSGQTAGMMSEFNASGRQSRLSLLAEGKLPNGTMRGYYEMDFLSAGTSSNNNQSNSYTMRQRQAWAQLDLNSGWTLTAGQMWSLATEYRKGLANMTEATPLTIDSNYNVGFTWERQYGFRVVKKIGHSLWFGGAVEEAQTLNIGGHNLPTLLYQQSGTSGGGYNSTTNYSFNYAPDLIAKLAYENRFGHYEVFGIGRFFRDRVFPNGAGANPSATSSTTSAAGAFTAKAAGGGVGANARVSLFDKRLDIGAHFLGGNSLGRYSTSQLPDATAHPDGSLELLVSGSALGSVEWHATPRLDVYSYYGGEYAKRAYYFTGYYVTTAGSTYGQPILGGYGAPNNDVNGCNTEVLPTTTNGGSVPGSATNCLADNRNIQEGTFGYWFRFYKGSHGTFQQGIQYSYGARHTWLGLGNPTLGVTNSPKATENMWFTSFRYYLPQ
jgi:hypothetical protein